MLFLFRIIHQLYDSGYLIYCIRCYIYRGDNVSCFIFRRVVKSWLASSTLFCPTALSSLSTNAIKCPWRGWVSSDLLVVTEFSGGTQIPWFKWNMEYWNKCLFRVDEDHSKFEIYQIGYLKVYLQLTTIWPTANSLLITSYKLGLGLNNELIINL